MMNPGNTPAVDPSDDSADLGIEEIIVEHDERLGDVEASVKSMRDAVEELLTEPLKGKPAPWNWKELDGEASVALMETLRDWVDWINSRYGVTDSIRIYGCWYRHGPVVEELTGAWIAWSAANYGHKNPVPDLAIWHERTFWPMMERITSKVWGLSNCHTEHVEPRESWRDSTDTQFGEFLSELGAKK